jgi:putative alpha-1,2-mannosidase
MYKEYVQSGYIFQESDSKSASLTLEFALDDGVLANVARYLNNSDDYALFLNRSLAYKNVYNSSEMLMCPRFSNGTFLCPFPLLIYPLGDTYTEVRE